MPVCGLSRVWAEPGVVEGDKSMVGFMDIFYGLLPGRLCCAFSFLLSHSSYISASNRAREVDNTSKSSSVVGPSFFLTRAFPLLHPPSHPFSPAQAAPIFSRCSVCGERSKSVVVDRMYPVDSQPIQLFHANYPNVYRLTLTTRASLTGVLEVDSYIISIPSVRIYLLLITYHDDWV